MRTTKALLCAAAVAAGAVTAMAQSNVYSLNVVGYVNVPLYGGFNMVANNLDVDGTGTNNTVVGIFSTNLPVNSAVYKYVNGGWQVANYQRSGKQTTSPVTWSTNYSANPGEGLFVKLPNGSNATVTLVGNVLQGALPNPYIPSSGGFALISAMTPRAGLLQADLGYVPQLNETVYVFTNDLVNGGGYAVYNYQKSGKQTSSPTNWSPAQPNIQVGQGFYLKAAANSTWSNYFIVQ